MAEIEVGNLNVKIGLDDTGLNKSMAELDRQMKLVQSEFRKSASGLNDFGKSTHGLKQKSESLTKQIDIQSQRVAELQRKHAEAAEKKGVDARETQNLQVKLNDAQAALNKMQGELKATNAEISKQSSVWTKFGESMDATGKKMQSVGTRMSEVGQSLSLLVTGPIVAASGASLKFAIDFESAFAGVRKTIDATESEFATFKQEIRDMSKEIPAAATEIAGVAEAAGQLGIKKEAIMGFTRTMVDLGVATNMTSNDAATALARLANITQMPQDQFDKLGSTIVGLGNNLATTESAIVEMGLRIAGAGNTVGLTEAQILSFAGALSSVGIEAEAGGSAISRVFINMNSAVAAGGKELAVFAGVAGMSAAEFKKAFRDDAATATVAFIEGLGRMNQAGKDLNPTLQALGLSEIVVRDALLRTAGAGDLVRNSLELGTKAWEENNALTKEAQERYETTASKLKIFWNHIKDIGITLGDALIPALTKTLQVMQPFIDFIAKLTDWFSKLSPVTQTVIIALAGIAAAIGPIVLILGTLISSVGTLISAFGAVSGAVASAGGIMALLSNPIGWVIAGIAALALAALALYEAWKNNWGGIQEKTRSVVNVIVAYFKNMATNISIAFNSLMNFVYKKMSSIMSYVAPVYNLLDKVMPGIKAGFDAAKGFVDRGVDSTTLKLADLKVEAQGVSDQLSKAGQSVKAAFSSSGDAAKNSMGDFRKLDAQSVQSGINMKDLADTGNQAASTFGGVAKEADKAGKKGAKSAKDTREEWKKTSDDMRASLDVIKAQFELTMLALGQNAEEAKKLNTELKFLKLEYKEQEKIVNNARKGYEDMLRTKGSAAKETAEAARSYATEAKALNELATKISDVELAIKRQAAATAESKEALEILRAEHEKAVAMLDLNATKVDELLLKQSHLNDTLEAQRVLVSDLTREYEAVREAKGADAEETRKAYMELIKAQTEEAKLQKEIRSTNKAISDQADQVRDLGVKLQDLVKKMDEVATKEKNELAKAHEEYQKKVADVNRKLVDDERKVTEQYQKALDDRARSLSNFVGLFDAVNNKQVSGDQLLENLRGQVGAFDDWQENIQSLAAKGIDQGLLEELRAMGPKAGSEIAALNTLSDDQLNEYVSLWKQKSQSARQEAAAQLEQQRIETQQKIYELRQQASQQLEAYRQDWEKKNAEIRANTQKEIDTINKAYQDIVTKSKDYGVNMMSSFIEGAQSKFSDLEKMLERMAQTIDNYMPHSPAKVGPLKRLGEWGPGMIDTFVAGIQDNMPKLESAINGMASITPGFMSGVESVGGNTTNYGGHVFNISVSGDSSGEQADNLLRELMRRGVRF